MEVLIVIVVLLLATVVLVRVGDSLNLPWPLAPTPSPCLASAVSPIVLSLLWPWV